MQIPTLKSNDNEWISWLLISAYAAALGIFFHESAHYLSAKMFGYPSVHFFLDKVLYPIKLDPVEFPLWQRGVVSLSGPLSVYIVMLGSAFFVNRNGITPLNVAPAFAVGIRNIKVYFTYYFYFSLDGERSDIVFDELKAAKNLGIHPDIIVGTSALLTLCIWIYIIGEMDKPRFIKLGLIFLGTTLGIAGYELIIKYVI